MKFTGKNNEYIEVVTINEHNSHLLRSSKESELSLIWFNSDNNKVTIDAIDYVFNTNDIISLTEFHNIYHHQLLNATLIRWNRSFYCVLDHDSEVSCKGILYYGASTIPIMKARDKDLDVLKTVLKMFLIEIESKDSLQLEMLQMMLKRFLILCTRIYKEQHKGSKLSIKNIDLIREFNFLVEQHFKTKRTVNEYADLLFKSPKTLSNLFKKYGDTTPLQYINNRTMLESRRLLSYTDRSISEISYDLGFADLQSFSRFFRKQKGCSPQQFRSREILTTK